MNCNERICAHGAGCRGHIPAPSTEPVNACGSVMGSLLNLRVVEGVCFAVLGALLGLAWVL